jgi:O-methyltransferase involved in polyketide biosynthesis
MSSSETRNDPPLGDQDDAARVANPARMYDYWLGGKDNYAADREAAEKLEKVLPEVPKMVRANRAFLQRAVRYLAQQGIQQFIDLGAGLPTQMNTHEIARETHSGARVVYVDHDPVVLAHARAILTEDGHTIAIDADVRHPESILGDPEVRALIDFDRPVGVLAMAVFHLLDGDAPWAIMRAFRAATAPGSHYAISHAEDRSGGAVTRVYRERTGSGIGRTREAFASMFTGLDLVAPGVVPCAQWRPDGDVPRGYEDLPLWAAVGRSPGRSDHEP